MFDRFSPRSQRVVIKVKQSYNKSRGTWPAHGRYLERDKSRFGDGFSKTEDRVHITKTLAEWEAAGDEKLHKIIISPEYAERLDLKEHTRELLAQMERDLSRQTEWVAILHKNTDNHHVHVALRGIDTAHKSLEIEEYLGDILRTRSRELVTKKLGPRLYPEILERREKELFSERLTDIDRALLWKADSNLIIRFPEKESSNWRQNKSREQERLRLTFLSELGLCENISPNSWRLSPDLAETLKRLSLRQQLIKEQVPGWEFVRTLKASGVIRKRLDLGETLTGRVVGTNIRDPFGDQQFMLVEGTDGVTYHFNQPKGAREGKVKVNDVVTLERRIAEISDNDTAEVTKREFTAVQIHSDWKKCLPLDYEAVATLKHTNDSREDAPRVGFANDWAQAVQERVAELRAKNFTPHDRDWKTRLEAIRFTETDSKAWEWNPRDYIESEGENAAPDSISEHEGKLNNENRLIVGEIQCVGEERILVKDIRDSTGRIVKLSDAGLSWAPSVGTTVSIQAKRTPHTEIRPSDDRIAELITSSGSIREENLKDNEKKYILARANTWTRWEILQQNNDGSYQLLRNLAAPSKQALLSLMEEKVSQIRLKVSEDVKRQPAWLKFLDEQELSSTASGFTSIDKLLKELGRLPSDGPVTWLTKALKRRQALWESRGIALDDNFEKNTRTWISEGLLPTTLAKGEQIIGRILDLSINGGRYLALDSTDGTVRYFKISGQIQEQINKEQLPVGNVIVLTGKSFDKQINGTVRTIYYTSLTRYIDWASSEELLKDARADQHNSIAQTTKGFAEEWKRKVAQIKDSLREFDELPLVHTKLRQGEELTGRIIDLGINDGEKLLLEGTDRKLHLIYQSKKIKEAIARSEITIGDVITLRGREFSLGERKIQFIDLSRLEHWAVSYALDKYAFTQNPEELSRLSTVAPTTFTREWNRQAAKRRRVLDARGYTLDDVEQLQRKKDASRHYRSARARTTVSRDGIPLQEIEIGSPLSGTVTEIIFSEESSRPAYLVIRKPVGILAHIRAARGIGHIVREGLVQSGDEVTLSTREFNRDGKQLYYTDVEHHNVRSKSLRSEETIFGRLLSRDLHKDRFALLDSPEGKIHLAISRTIRNQIKSQDIRVGDVIFFSAKKVFHHRLERGATVISLTAIPLRDWKRSEEFDREVIRYLQTGTLNEVLPAREGFRDEWNKALQARAEKLREAGIGLSDNWADELQQLRERERHEEQQRRPELGNILSHDLRHISRLESLFTQATQAGWIAPTEANALNFVSAAVRATEHRRDPVRHFIDIVKENNWKQIHQQDEDKARRLLAGYRNRFANAFLVPLNREDELTQERKSESERGTKSD